MATYQVSVEYLTPSRSVVLVEAESAEDACARAPELANCGGAWTTDDDDATPIYVRSVALAPASGGANGGSPLDVPAEHSRDVVMARAAAEGFI